MSSQMVRSNGATLTGRTTSQGARVLTFRRGLDKVAQVASIILVWDGRQSLARGDVRRPKNTSVRITAESPAGFLRPNRTYLERSVWS